MWPGSGNNWRRSFDRLPGQRLALNAGVTRVGFGQGAARRITRNRAETGGEQQGVGEDIQHFMPLSLALRCCVLSCLLSIDDSAIFQML